MFVTKKFFIKIQKLCFPAQENFLKLNFFYLQHRLLSVLSSKIASFVLEI